MVKKYGAKGKLIYSPSVWVNCKGRVSLNPLVRRSEWNARKASEPHIWLKQIELQPGGETVGLEEWISKAERKVLGSYKAQKMLAFYRVLKAAPMIWEAKFKHKDQLEECWIALLSKKHPIVLELLVTCPNWLISAQQNLPLARCTWKNSWSTLDWVKNFNIWLSYNFVTFWYFGSDILVFFNVLENMITSFILLIWVECIEHIWTNYFL